MISLGVIYPVEGRCLLVLCPVFRVTLLKDSEERWVAKIGI